MPVPDSLLGKDVWTVPLGAVILLKSSGTKEVGDVAENEIPHILAHRRVMKNENTWTQGREYYTLVTVGGERGGPAGVGAGEG